MQSEQAKQSSEPDLDTTQLLEPSDKEFKITVIRMLKAFIENVDNMQDR